MSAGIATRTHNARAPRNVNGDATVTVSARASGRSAAPTRGPEIDRPRAGGGDGDEERMDDGLVVGALREQLDHDAAVRVRHGAHAAAREDRPRRRGEASARRKAVNVAERMLQQARAVTTATADRTVARDG